MSTTPAAARGLARRRAIHDTIARALAAGLPLDVAALAAIAVRDAEPWNGHISRSLPRPVAVELGERITLMVRPGPRWSDAGTWSP